MSRPTKTQDYLVHRIADLLRIADFMARRRATRKRKGIAVRLPDGQWVTVNTRDDVALAVGRLLCDLKPELRPEFLRQIANVDDGKTGKKRKGRVDDIAKIRQAYRNAKAKLKGLYRGDNPTFHEVDQEYRKRTGWSLDRRALKDAGCSFRPESKKLPRRQK